jgi:membrane protease YdiL (CAAX protease family)
MSALGVRLSDSAFLADIGDRERTPWRVLLALFGGMAAFLVVAVAAVLVVFVILIWVAHWPVPVGRAGAQALEQKFLALSTSDGRSWSDALTILLVAIPSNVLPMFAFIGMAMLAHGRRLKSFLTAAPRFRWRLLLSGLVLSLVLIGPFLILADLFGGAPAAAPPLLTVSSDNGRRALFAAICCIAFLAAAAGEEILFRGWLLRELAVVTRNPAALMIVNGIVFAAAHFDFAPDAFLTRAIMGAGLSYMTLRLGGVEFSTGAHFANNIMLVLFLEPLTLKPSPGGGLDVTNLVSVVGLFVAYVAMSEITARWAPLRHWSGADQTLQPTSSAVAEHFA